MQWYTDVLKKYITFTGRARRKEFWMFTLISFIVSAVLSILDNIIGWTNGTGNGVLNSLYGLAVLLPSLAVAARRLHDTNRSAAWLFLILLVVIGWIILLVFYVQEGNAGDNNYGPDPKAAERFGAPGSPNAEPGYPTV